MRNKFQRELETLNLDLIKMGLTVEKAIDDSVKALVSQDKELCGRVIAADKEVDDLTSDIESKALKILLMQQPVASDLRKISTALKIVTDLERIGDQARNICGIVLHLCDEEYRRKLVLIPQMAELGKRMVKDCVESFIKLDAVKAESIVKADDTMDELFVKVKQNMIELIGKDARCADMAIYLMMVAKYFEKIGDHAENIADWVIFCLSGEHKHKKLL
jgi:phosphate transport system protein